MTLPRRAAAPAVATVYTWKSGAGMPSVGSVSHIANGDFNVWRGRSGPPAIATTWQDAQYSAPSTGLTYLDAGGTYDTWAGDMDVTIGGLWSTANGGDATASNNTWAAAATGSYDSRWTTILNNVKTHWTRLTRGTLYLRFCHEMNATWYDWQVGSTEIADFITAWRRFRGLQQSIFPASKLAFSTITATNRPSDMYDWRTLWPGDTYVDILSTDYYGDSYKNTVWAGASGFDGSGGPRNLPEYLTFANTHGKPLAISEWGVDPIFGTGDDPNFIQYVFDFATANAGTTAGHVPYECYFNESKSSTDRRQLYYVAGEPDANGRTTTEFPLAAARYQALF
jgi:hypothetical protein